MHTNTNEPSIPQHSDFLPITRDFNIIWKENATYVFNVARKMLNNDNDADDVTQQVAMSLNKNLEKFKGESSWRTWLHKVTVNEALAYREKRSRHSDHGNIENWEVVDENSDPQLLYVQAEERRLLYDAMKRLPHKYAIVLELADIDGLPNKMIGERLGISESAVKSTLHRARAGVQAMIRGETMPDGLKHVA